MSVSDPTLSSFAIAAKQVWFWPVIRGVIAIVFGILALAWPGITALVLVVMLGIFTVVDGIVEIINGIRYRGTGGGGAHILIGALSLALGTVLLVWPGKTATVLVWFIGLWALLVGILQIGQSLTVRKVPGSGWGWGLLVGLLSLAFGVLILFNVTAGLLSIVWLVGLWAVMWGGLLILLGFRLRALGRRAGQTIFA